MTPQTIHLADIRSLRSEARAAGDAAQVDLCDLASTLPGIRAEVEADDAGHDDTDYQAAFGGSLAERLAAAQRAWDLCVEAIQAAAAMAD